MKATRKNAYDLAMDKVDRFLSAKSKDKSKFGGQKEAYATTIIKLVAIELNLEIKLDKIARLSGNPLK